MVVGFIVFINCCRGDRPVALTDKPFAQMGKPGGQTDKPFAPTGKPGDAISGDRPVAPTDNPVAITDNRVVPTGPRSRSIGAVMAGFKSAVTKRINELHTTPGAKLWQRNYWEHIVRNETELDRIREYIRYMKSISSVVLRLMWMRPASSHRLMISLASFFADADDK